MNRRVKALFAVMMVALGFWAWHRHATAQAWLQMEAKASAVKTEIDTRFAVGAPQSEVVDFLRKRFGRDIRGGEDSYWFSVGQAPNRNWRLICGPWDVGVEVKFRAARLANTTATARGIGCL